VRTPVAENAETRNKIGREVVLLFVTRTHKKVLVVNNVVYCHLGMKFCQLFYELNIRKLAKNRCSWENRKM